MVRLHEYAHAEILRIESEFGADSLSPDYDVTMRPSSYLVFMPVLPDSQYSMALGAAQVRVGIALRNFPSSVDEFTNQIETLDNSCPDLDEAGLQSIVFRGDFTEIGLIDAYAILMHTRSMSVPQSVDQGNIGILDSRD